MEECGDVQPGEPAKKCVRIKGHDGEHNWATVIPKDPLPPGGPVRRPEVVSASLSAAGGRRGSMGTHVHAGAMDKPLTPGDVLAYVKAVEEDVAQLTHNIRVYRKEQELLIRDYNERQRNKPPQPVIDRQVVYQAARDEWLDAVAEVRRLKGAKKRARDAKRKMKRVGRKR